MKSIICNKIISIFRMFLFLVATFNPVLYDVSYAQDIVTIVNTLAKSPIKVELPYKKNCQNITLNECANLAYKEAEKAAVNHAIDQFINSLPEDTKLNKNKLKLYLTGIIIGNPIFSEDDWIDNLFSLKILTVVEIKISDDLKREFIKVKEAKEHDTVRPTGELNQIRNAYNIEDTVSYTIKGKDNISLKRITFEVKNSSVKELWNVSGKSVEKSSSFSTQEWHPGIYYYSLLIEDSEGNSKEYTGSFILAEKIQEKDKESSVLTEKIPEPDTTKPTGKISKIGSTYTEGDKVHYTVQAQDNKSLKKMTFRVKETSVKETWNISGESASQKSSFSTRNWNAGTYRCSLVIEDDAGNSNEYTESFSLKKETDPPPTGEITGVKERYTVGDTIFYKINANDNNLKEMQFRVKNSSVKKAWGVKGKTSAEYEDSFSTDNWNSGKYDYSFSVKEIAGNSKEYTGNFILNQSDDTIPPKGKVTVLGTDKTTGDTIKYIVRAEDNNALKKMSFKVGNMTVKSWNLSGKEAEERNDFSTNGWNPGKYNYSFIIEDRSGNSQEYTGDFILAKKVSDRVPEERKEETGRVSEEKKEVIEKDKVLKDKSNPKGSISGIRSNYKIGDIINYTAEAKDDKSLKSMVFKIGSSTLKRWTISGQKAAKNDSFSTKNWKAGNYYYALFTEDIAGNIDEYKGSFVLENNKKDKHDVPAEDDKSDIISKRFEELKTLKQNFSASYNKYKGLKDREKQGINVKSSLVSAVKEIIAILKKMENLYKQFPQTSEIKQGILDTKNALKGMEEELFLLTR